MQQRFPTHDLQRFAMPLKNLIRFQQLLIKVLSVCEAWFCKRRKVCAGSTIQIAVFCYLYFQVRLIKRISHVFLQFLQLL